MMTGKYFPYFVCILLTDSIAVQKFLRLMSYLFRILAFTAYAFGMTSKKSLPDAMS